MRRTPRRSGFTLLEVLLASLIAILLLAALYFAMDVTLRQTQEGRDALDVDNVSRAVFHRMTIDLGAALAPLPPKSGGNAAIGTAGGTTATTTSTSTTTTTTATTATAAGSSTTTASATTSSTGSVVSASGTSTDATSGTASPQADIGFQAGVIGTDTQLTIFVSRLPHALTDTGALLQPTDPNVQTPCDQYRISYWKGQSGHLCRQERPWVTADGVRDTFTPDLSNEVGDTLAEEVTEVLFEYFDGSGWVSSWDGTIPGPDGVTPQGPPRAVRVTLTFSVPSSRPGTPPNTQQAIQVIPIRAAPGLYTPTLIMPDTDSGTTSSDTSSNSGSGSAGGSSGSSGGASGGGGATMSSGTGGGGGATAGGAKAGGTTSSAAGGGAKAGGSTGGTAGGGKGGGR